MQGETRRKIDTMFSKSRAIRDLLGKVLADTADIVGVPPSGESKDAVAPISSLDFLSDELETIHGQADILHSQVKRIKEKIGVCDGPEKAEC